jgi:hypothetical protein
MFFGDLAAVSRQSTVRPVRLQGKTKNDSNRGFGPRGLNMWIETADGEYVNLDHVIKIDARHVRPGQSMLYCTNGVTAVVDLSPREIVQRYSDRIAPPIEGELAEACRDPGPTIAADNEKAAFGAKRPSPGGVAMCGIPTPHGANVSRTSGGLPPVTIDSPPEVLEPVRTKLRIPDGVLNVLVPKMGVSARVSCPLLARAKP